MINYDNTWPWVCFSSEFDELQITATSPITLTIASKSELLLQNKYTPISDKVSVYDLDRLLATSDSDMLAQYEFAVSWQGAKGFLSSGLAQNRPCLALTLLPGISCHPSWASAPRRLTVAKW